MYYRLQQQIPGHQKIGRVVCGKSHYHNKNNICQIWHTPKIHVRCKHKFCFWQVPSVLQVNQCRTGSITCVSSSKQQTCWSLIKFIKCTFKKCTNSGRDVNMSPATLMFGRPVHGIMPIVNCKPIGQDYDDEHHHKLVDRQQKMTMMLHQFSNLSP